MIQKYSALKQAKDSSGGYISLSLNLEDAKEIHAAAKSLGIKDLIPAEKMHVTVVYDSRNPDIDVDIDKSISFPAKLDSTLVLGSGKWESIAYVLSDCPELKEFHNSFLRQGFQHIFHTYTPHISIKYQPTKEDVKLIEKELPSLLLEKGIKSVTLEKPKQGVAR